MGVVTLFGRYRRMIVGHDGRLHRRGHLEVEFNIPVSRFAPGLDVVLGEGDVQDIDSDIGFQGAIEGRMIMHPTGDSTSTVAVIANRDTPPFLRIVHDGAGVDIPVPFAVIGCFSYDAIFMGVTIDKGDDIFKTFQGVLQFLGADVILIVIFDGKE